VNSPDRTSRRRFIRPHTPERSPVSPLVALVLSFAALASTWAPVASAQDAPRVVGRQPAARAITLPAILAPREGSAAFYILEESLEAVAEASGIFASMRAFNPDRYTLYVVRAHYTVLESQGDSALLLVRAQPVHPDTGWPIAPVRWERTYRLRPDGPEYVAGSSIPESYEELVTPYWLADWSAAALADLPAGPIVPGTAWSGPANFDWDGLPVPGLQTPVNGSFVEWVDAGELGSAAHISEGFATEGAQLEELFSGIYGVRSLALEAASDHWLLDGDFPYGTEKWLYMYSLVSVGPDTGAPQGIEGEFHIEIEMAQSVWRDLDEVLWLPYEEPESIEPGESILGLLGPWNDVLDDGAFVNAYAFYGEKGEAVDILLTSPDFDAYLMFVDEEFQPLALDDDSLGGTDALISVELPYTGTYYILVTSVREAEEGLYALEVLPGGAY